MDSIIAKLENLYRKTPSLPSSAREALVGIVPWLALIGGVILVWMAIIDLTSSPFVAILQGQVLAYLMLTAVLNLASGIFLLAAFSPLRKRSRRGWKLLFFVQMIFLLGALLSLNMGTIVFNLVFVAILLYPLFQMKPYYK